MTPPSGSSGSRDLEGRSAPGAFGSVRGSPRRRELQMVGTLKLWAEAAGGGAGAEVGAAITGGGGAAGAAGRCGGGPGGAAARMAAFLDALSSACTARISRTSAAPRIIRTRSVRPLPHHPGVDVRRARDGSGSRSCVPSSIRCFCPRRPLPPRPERPSPNHTHALVSSHTHVQSHTHTVHKCKRSARTHHSTAPGSAPLLSGPARPRRRQRERWTRPACRTPIANHGERRPPSGRGPARVAYMLHHAG